MRAVLVWYLGLLAGGFAVMPSAAFLFRHFEDRGWLFARALSLFFGAYFTWTLNVLKWSYFTQGNIQRVLVVFFVLNYGTCAVLGTRRKRSSLRAGADPLAELFSGINIQIVFIEELVFFATFAAWVYIIGFRPEAYGTEKFMDYGFMTSMMRSLTMPFEDPWFSGETVNYYYGGQYIATYLTKMTGVTAGEGYSLMRASVAAFSFVLPMALVRQMMADRIGRRGASWCAGLLAGCGVAYCGNGHYLLYGIIRPLMSKLQGVEYSYWFPDSTRYIGYDPDLPDKTIHEFPAYSTVLGDLHAHYINIIFVISVVALAYAWAQKYVVAPVLEQTGKNNQKRGVWKWNRRGWPERVPHVLLIGFLTGSFRWTNFWDFPIYYVVAGSIFFFVQLRDLPPKGERASFIGKFVLKMLLIAAVMFAAGYLAALPFTATFDQISSEIGMTHSHSLWYQMLILWGLPAACLVGYVLTLAREGRSARKRGKIILPDLCVLMLGLCAAGLVFLPEVIYVKDIYAETHYRANTMFKLTYQAYILFGMMMGYVLVRGIVLGREILNKREHVVYVLSVIGTVVLLLMGGYIIQSCRSWFGNVFNPSDRINTDASVFVSEYYPSDFDAVNYLNTEVSGQPVVLEAPGDSYSDYERISVATGLPTVAGWHTHEWLWRGDTAELDERIADVQTIYTSFDETEVRALIEKYDIAYIYVGNLEREKYADLNDVMLQSLGDVVYSDGYETYIVKVK